MGDAGGPSEADGPGNARGTGDADGAGDSGAAPADRGTIPIARAETAPDGGTDVAATDADATAGRDTSDDEFAASPEPAVRRRSGPTGATVGDRGGRDRRDPAEFDAETEGALTVRSVTTRRTSRWVGVAGLSFLTAGLGIATSTRPLLLAAVVGVVYLAYANVTPAPTPSLSAARRVSDATPEPGDEVEVTVSVTNTGDSSLPDLRVVEQVPDALSVERGPARAATALRPGATMTFSYTVTARRGEFDFDGLTLVVRNASGSEETEFDLSMAPTTVTCVPPVDATDVVPLHALTSPYTGRVATATAGEGVEFASVREYQHGDPLSRLDWNRYARDGTLATMEFREERMATVVLLVDLRQGAYVQSGEGGRNAVERSIDATHRLFNSLLDTGDRVGIAALSTDDIWLSPGAGPTHQAEARHLLATHPALSPTPPDERVYVRPALRMLVGRLPDEAQVVFCTPMVDDAAAYVARRLHVRGHPVTVVSPDATRRDTVGRTLASVERSNRLSELRTTGIRVIDWGEDKSLFEALVAARRRWSA
ncbi:MAG: DUF58 domain-containing protein [Haloarculaceae archaeon]